RAVVAAHAAHWRRAETRRPQVGAAGQAVAVELARRYLPYRAYPGKAVRLLEELRAAHEGAVDDRGVGVELGPEQVYDGFAAQTCVPTFLLRDDQPLSVDELVARLGRRMIGQPQAVRRVAETLCTVKAQLQPPDKPLATFLFVGPTGVGKTELARSLAHLLFGKEDRLVRFDMSEYADAWAAERLVRGSDSGDGLLTARIREQPFSVVLLDEIEKAHPAVHDLLLQVAGEGRLTDARGRTSWFHNAIIILTSNLGAHHGGTAIGLRAASPSGRDAELARYRAAVAGAFRPEMQNRFDAVIAFHGLDRDEVAAVARLQLERLADRRGLVQAQVGLDVSEAALAALAAGGTSAVYGVRALRRHLDEQVVRPAARLLARAGADAHGGVIAVRVAGEPLGLELPAGAHLATVTGAAPASGGADDDVPAIAVGLWRRGGGSVRRRAQGPARLSMLRRDADVWMHRDLVGEAREQRTWLRAQLAHGDAQGARGKAGKKKRDALSIEQRQQMATELHRIDGALTAAQAALDEIGAAEELAIEAALAGQDQAELTAMADELRGRFETAMFRVAVARLEHRDEIMLMLSAPEVATPLVRWVRGLVDVLAVRRWTLLAHAMAARDQAGAWPTCPSWGPPRSVAWLEQQLDGDGPRNLLVRVSGPDAALHLGLEVGAHRFVGLAKADPCHLVVRVLARALDLDDADWTRLSTIATPALPPRGEVERVYPAADHLTLGGARVDVPFAEQFVRYPELGLAIIARALAAGRSVAELYGSELESLLAAEAVAKERDGAAAEEDS
ncbi:MAG TPA: AAA family ATPase, partial [Kofleriaceae bacterium]|nr:AAA family ATPase [Kofleriaceae bacterium]